MDMDSDVEDDGTYLDWDEQGMDIDLDENDEEMDISEEDPLQSNVTFEHEIKNSEFLSTTRNLCRAVLQDGDDREPFLTAINAAVVAMQQTPPFFNKNRKAAERFLADHQLVLLRKTTATIKRPWTWP